MSMIDRNEAVSKFAAQLIRRYFTGESAPPDIMALRREYIQTHGTLPDTVRMSRRTMQGIMLVHDLSTGLVMENESQECRCYGMNVELADIEGARVGMAGENWKQPKLFEAYAALLWELGKATGRIDSNSADAIMAKRISEALEVFEILFPDCKAYADMLWGRKDDNR